jgi:hypothetical protein
MAAPVIARSNPDHVMAARSGHSGNEIAWNIAVDRES